MASRTVFGLVQSSIAHPPPRLLAKVEATFRLATGEIARLPRRDIRAEALLSLLEDAVSVQVPVLVEVNDANEVVEVRVPLPADKVSSIAPLGPDFNAVQLTLSQMRHRLRRDHPNFEVLRHKLEAALKGGTRVFVTVDDEGAIVHVEDTDLPPFGGPGSKLVHRRSRDDGRASGRH